MSTKPNPGERAAHPQEEKLIEEITDMGERAMLYLPVLLRALQEARSLVETRTGKPSDVSEPLLAMMMASRLLMKIDGRVLHRLGVTADMALLWTKGFSLFEIAQQQHERVQGFSRKPRRSR